MTQHKLESLIDQSQSNNPLLEAVAIDQLCELIPSISDPSSAYTAIAHHTRNLTPNPLRVSAVIDQDTLKRCTTFALFAKALLRKLNTPEALAILYPNRKQSKLYLPNRWVHDYFNAFKSIFATPLEGERSLVAVTQLYNSTHLLWDRFPPNNDERRIDFVDIATFNEGMLAMYGQRAGQHFQFKTGEHSWATFRPMLLSAISNELSLQTNLLRLLEALAKLFSEHSDMVALVGQEDNVILFKLMQCPHCWGLQKEEAICYPMVGLLSSLVQEVIIDSQPFTIVETECQAKGDAACVFRLDYLSK